MSAVAMILYSTIATNKRNARRNLEGLHCIVESLCRCAVSLSYVIALLALRLQTGTKPKWQLGRMGRGGVTHGMKYSTGKGVFEHAAQPGTQLIGCRVEANNYSSRPCCQKMHAMYYCTMKCSTSKDPSKKHHTLSS